MKLMTGAAAALLLLAAPPARAASSEPELLPLSPAGRPPSRRGPPPPAPRAPPAAPVPFERDDAREAIRLGPPRRPFLTVRSRYWLARSSVNTRYSIQFPRELVDPPGEVFFGETEERAASGGMLLNSAELAPLSWLSGEFVYGTDRLKGRYFDRYWLHSPHSETLTRYDNGAVWHRPDHEDDTVFQADHAARREWISANLHFRAAEGRVTGSDELEVRHALDMSVGAHRFSQRSRFTNLARTLSTGKFFAPAPVGPIQGFDATYDASWAGPHIGFREDVLIPFGFAFDAQFLWSPFATYRGDGFNNLDGGLRASSPNYEDRARGSAIHFSLGASWSFSVVRLEAGYMRLSFTSNHGNRRYFLADGTHFDQAVETTRTEASGLYAGGSLRF
ncbi:MAG: hypothetical protein Q8T11_15865 [Elusimicrobiota bacterium]|nr:hypothetical protein [Elusimicrobiota bacterium]